MQWAQMAGAVLPVRVGAASSGAAETGGAGSLRAEVKEAPCGAQMFKATLHNGTGLV
jgi:hypothetical protein